MSSQSGLCECGKLCLLSTWLKSLDAMDLERQLILAQNMRQAPRSGYRRPSLIESIFSTVIQKLSSRAPGRTLATQTRQALLLGVAYNLYRLKPSMLSTRMSTEPPSL